MLGDPQPSRLMLEKPEVIKQNMKLEPQESLDAYRPPTGRLDPKADSVKVIGIRPQL
jgi:hypothetical protein